jgi:type I protein arginine methyltransferase
MIADGVRVRAYAEALRRAVTPGSTVVDIGAGTGIFTLLACKFGAARVYAVDPNPVVSLVEQAARENGFAERVVVVQDLSTRFAPETRADVIVSDLRGVLPFWEGHLEAVVDARERLLSAGGALIPARDSIFGAVVSAPERYAELTRPWEDDRYGVDLSAGRSAALNTWIKYRFAREQLLSTPVLLQALDYRRAATAEARFSAAADFTVERGGTAHGIGLWFDTELHDGIGFSNAPGEPDALYGRAFMPWLHPVTLSQGFTVRASVQAWSVAGPYVWCWKTTVLDGRGEPVADFAQSTFDSAPPDLNHLHRGSGTHVPTRSREVELDAFVLALIDGRTELGEIARRMLSAFPGEFVEEHAALDYAARCARRYP